MLFEFVGPILQNLFIRANKSESERLATEYRSFIVCEVATIHAKILVFVRGFNMQVNPDPTVFQIGNRV